TSSQLVVSLGAELGEPRRPTILLRHGDEDGIAFRAVAADRKRDVAIIGAALDLGQGRRGVDMGPSAMRYAGLEERLTSLGYGVRDHGHVETAVPEATALRDERARFLPDIIEACKRMTAKV